MKDKLGRFGRLFFDEHFAEIYKVMFKLLYFYNNYGKKIHYTNVVKLLR